jgi:RNA polymerase sigma-70 factor (ECF subfamily)
MQLQQQSAYPRGEMVALNDDALVDLARDGDETAVRVLVRRHNQRLFRAARSITGNDGDAEDAVQAAYIKAFSHLDSFRGEAQLTTWLTRIAINEALARIRRRRPSVGVDQIDLDSAQGAHVVPFPMSAASADPEAEMSRSEVRQILEQAVDALPAAFRAVFVLREVEGLSTEETAQQLSIRPETVKTRLFRARRLLRAAIEEQFSGAFPSLFPFDGARCVFMADRVIEGLRALSPD